MIRVDEYEDWLRVAKPGEEIIYYQTTRLPIPQFAMGRYTSLLSRVYKSTERKQVILLQKRVKTDCDGSQIAYIARRVSPGAPAHLFPRPQTEAHY